MPNIFAGCLLHTTLFWAAFSWLDCRDPFRLPGRLSLSTTFYALETPFTFTGEEDLRVICMIMSTWVWLKVLVREPILRESILFWFATHKCQSSVRKLQLSRTFSKRERYLRTGGHILWSYTWLAGNGFNITSKNSA